MSKIGIFLSSIVAAVALAIFMDINLAWYLADFLLTGKIPYFDVNIGFFGSILVLGFFGFMIGRIFKDAKADILNSALETSKSNSAKNIEKTDTISIAEALRDDSEEDDNNDSMPADDLEEIAIA